MFSTCYTVTFIAHRSTDMMYRIIILLADIYGCETWSVIAGGTQAEGV